MQKKFVCLRRVSSRRQERTGIGLKAQKVAILDYIRKENGIIVKWFTEVESGMRKERVILQQVLTCCRKHKAELVVSVQSRFSRNATFICSTLEPESGIKFTAVDRPHATNFEKRIQAVVDQEEWDRIRNHACNTVRVKRKEGAKLGTNGKKLARYYKKQRALQDRKLRPIIRKLRRDGMTVREITQYLTRHKVKNLRGGHKWYESVVHAIMHRNKIR